MNISKALISVPAELAKFYSNQQTISIGFAEFGTGVRNLLCLPGAIGSFKTDYGPQLDTQNAFDPNIFNTVVWDPPGYGTSRPLYRDFSGCFYERDAAMAFSLMKKLGKIPFTVLGWSDGAITAMFLAHQQRNTDNIEDLVLFGGNSYITDEDVNIYEGIRNIDAWSDRMKGPFLEVYGEEDFRKLWNDYTDGILWFKSARDGNICKDLLPEIPNPTLVINGAKDPVVPPFHAEYLQCNIPNASLAIHPEGKHNVHLRYPDWFKETVQKFLLREGSKI